MTRREQTISLLERRLSNIDRDIAELQQQMEHADPKLREDLSKSLESIRESRQQVEGHLNKLQIQAAESWTQEDLEAGMFAILDNIGRKLDKLLGRSS